MISPYLDNRDMQDRASAGAVVDGGVRDLKWLLRQHKLLVFARYRSPIQSKGLSTMRDRTTGNDDTAIAGLLLSAQLQEWAPSHQDIAWLVEQIALRADDWARLAHAVVDEEESALCFDPRCHD